MKMKLWLSGLAVLAIVALAAFALPLGAVQTTSAAPEANAASHQVGTCGENFCPNMYCPAVHFRCDWIGCGEDNCCSYNCHNAPDSCEHTTVIPTNTCEN